MTVTEIIAIGTEIVTLIGVVVPVFKMIKTVYKTIKSQTDKIELINDGIRCQLRTEMMNTYYDNKANEAIREYELENFIKCYNAYKALGGNSFIDRIYEEVIEWSVTR